MPAGITLITVAGLALLGVVAFLSTRAWRLRRNGPSAGPSASRIEDLDRRARSMLVRVDDAIKTSADELGFARAELGDEALEPFAAAVGEAKEHVAASFRLRNLLDDTTSEDAPARCAMLEDIVSRLASADELLDERATAFDELRDLEGNPLRVLETVTAVATEARARLGGTRSGLEAMSLRYAPSALEPVAANGEQAADLLEFVSAATARAREKLSAGIGTGVVAATLAAQQAAAQADRLMEAVDSAAADLDEVTRGLPEAIGHTERDLDEAKTLLAGDRSGPERAGRVTAAEHALDGVRRELASGPLDPLDASKRLEQADLSLGDVLGSVRDDNARSVRAEASLEQSVLAARAEVTGVGEFVATRRGGIGSEARTRLAAAEHSLAGVSESARSDPVAARDRAHRAHEQAARARRLAIADVGIFRAGTIGGAGVGAAMLAGILIDTSSAGGTGAATRGVAGPVAGRTGRGPGSYGGTGTRGRRGGC